MGVHPTCATQQHTGSTHLCFESHRILVAVAQACRIWIHMWCLWMGSDFSSPDSEGRGWASFLWHEWCARSCHQPWSPVVESFLGPWKARWLLVSGCLQGTLLALERHQNVGVCGFGSRELMKASLASSRPGHSCPSQFTTPPHSCLETCIQDLLAR